MKACGSCLCCYDDEVTTCVQEGHTGLAFLREGRCDIISGYRIEKCIDHGSNRFEFSAKQTETGHPCTIKILAANSSLSSSFSDEASAAVNFFNPTVADTYEAGSLENGEYFVVTETSGGQTVRELLNNVGTPQLLTSLQIVRQAAEAVHALHVAGILHRAISPENILLTTDQEHRLSVRVQGIDLGGVCTHSVVSNKFTIDGSIDKIRYFAPEVFGGGSASPRSDIYGLGVVLYELLTGSPPFDADTASALIDQHKNRTPADVNINSFDLRMLVTHTLMESLRKQPEQRQTTANAFARQLRHIEQLATHSPTPPPAAIEEPRQSAPVVAYASTAAIRKIHVPETIDIDSITQLIRPAENVTVISPKTAPAVAIAELEYSALPHPMPAANIAVSKIETRSETQPLVNQAIDRQRDDASLPEIRPSAASLSPPSRLRGKRRRAQHQVTMSTPISVPISQQLVSPPEISRAIVPVSAEPRVPRKIEYAVPDDDVPSLADVQAVLSEEPAQFEGLDRYDVGAVSVQEQHRETLKIEWLQPEDDLPSFEEIEAVRLPENLCVSTMTPVEAAIAEPAMATNFSFAQPEVRSERFISNDPDEITLVSPRRDLIRIDLDNPRTPRRSTAAVLRQIDASSEIEYLPTIIGSSRTVRAANQRNTSVLNYSRPGVLTEPLIYRSTMIAGGIAIFVLISLIASFVVTDSVMSSRAEEPTSKLPVAKEQPKRAIQPTVSESRTQETIEKDIPAYQPIADRRIEPRTEKEKPTTAPEKVVQAPKAEPSVPSKPKATTAAKETPSVKTTLVISSENGKVRSKVESDKRSSASRAGFATRPRIVANPER